MPTDIEQFHAIAISRIAHAMKAEGASIIHMEFGQPSTGAPRAAIAAAHEILDTDGMGYWESSPLKTRIARLYADRHGVSVDPERIILTCGASPAFVLALSCLFAPGARVALARPGYVAYRNTLKALHLQPIELACGDAAGLAARHGLQVHGAMGYAWDTDLQMFMKRAWALDASWGDRGFHKARVADFVLSKDAPLGPGNVGDV